jgi:spore coat protein CotH
MRGHVTRLAVGLVATACVPAAAAPPADDVFVPTKVWQFHLTVPAKEFAAMEPAAPAFPFGPPGAPKKDPPKPDEPGRDTHKGGSFGLEFPWAHADLAVDGKTYRNVGLRYKGGGSYVMSAGRLKRNLKVDLDRYDEAQRFHGLKAMNLNAGTMDATHLKEALAFSIFRDAGIPTPRTAFAEVTLTVPGKYDQVLVGTYTLIEQVDKTFLKDHFKTTKGLLMKPEVRPGGRGPLAYLGDDWEPYKASLLPKHDPTKAEAERVIAFVKLINRGTDEVFRKEIGNYLDVDEYLRFLAVTAVLANLDSFFVGGHNAYLYLHPETNKIVILPWDLDLSFGGFFLMGQPDQQADLSITHPYPGEHRLTDRLLAIPEIGEKYRKLVRELTTTVFTKEKIAARLTELEKATKEARDRETKAVAARRENTGFGGFPGGPGGQAPQDLRAWVDKRLASVTAQLDGKSKGTIPGGFGFGGPPPGGPGGFGGPPGMRPPRPGEVLPDPLRTALRLTEDQRKKFDELQREIDGKVEQLLTEEQRAMLRRIREGQPGGRPGGIPGGPVPGKGPGG